MEEWRREPEVATPRAVGAAFGVFYVAGGLVALLVAASDSAGAPGRPVLTALGASALLVGAVVAARRAHLPRLATHPLAALATGLIGAAVLVTPDPRSAVLVAAVSVFVTVDTGVFFARLHALVHLSACLATTTATLLVRGGVGLLSALALDLVLVAVALVVGVLARRASSASVDGLTGLPNRRGLDDALERLALAAGRSGGPLSVALVDLDGFKAVNDASGHDAGDELLRATAARWRAVLPRSALLARVGGDEFAVALAAPPAELALVLSPLVRDPGRPASAGVAAWAPPEGPAAALHRADAALYRAKRGGRARCEVAGPETASVALATDLRAAVAAGAVRPVYQPLVAADAPGGPPVGVEALARWTHPLRGAVSPDVFVAVAEAHGFVGELGAAVLERACHVLASLPEARERGLVLAVNVSGLELVDDDYVERLAAVLDRTGWPAAQLVLEVTESVVEGGDERAVATHLAARVLGVRMAVDDFGTGYSSLSRLDRLPAAYLELDAGFTATAHTCAGRARLVRAVTAMSRSLGLYVVAEGVETPEQGRALAGLGCDLLQGFALGRPEPLASLAARLRRPSAAPAGDAHPGSGLADVPGPRRATADDAAPGSRAPRPAV
ncbi:bifunctional diguanylate cyclase/phosphodiesterase [uncultured Pseudokineococcus sp.]|uniref:putative bifunctional diguanylate cyclase/phosphodiesterase n=1 Tax=uncultured Pseudokineococcus sp. TaxID=1642928 RepID=UPI00261C3CBF|nr:bifunctional diguanylate cyclase/phosphodiesterase [uncultured Pseudokineococcus sp.]